MDKDECLRVINKLFKIESCLSGLKSPDFKLKSHTFFFKDIFKDVGEIKILKISSINPINDITFSLYYISDCFNDLYYGYFKINPESKNAAILLKNMPPICTDLWQYLFFVYQNNEYFKKYLILCDIKSVIENYIDSDYLTEFNLLKGLVYNNISELPEKEFLDCLVTRNFTKKYISNFIKLNSKLTEEVKIFCATILLEKYQNHICIIHNTKTIKNHIEVYFNNVSSKYNAQIPIYRLLDLSIDNNLLIFIKFKYDFKGGENIV